MYSVIKPGAPPKSLVGRQWTYTFLWKLSYHHWLGQQGIQGFLGFGMGINKCHSIRQKLHRKYTTLTILDKMNQDINSIATIGKDTLQVQEIKKSLFYKVYYGNFLILLKNVLIVKKKKSYLLLSINNHPFKKGI